MSKFHFWAAIVLAFVLGLSGLALAQSLPLPPPFTPNKTRAIYVLIGVLIALSYFSRLSRFVVMTTTSLAKKVVSDLASELLDQFNKATTRKQIMPEGTPAQMEEYAGAIILDTSSIIDGRILDVAKAGFILGLILVPEFVLREMQQVADSADHIKRSRGRRGFEIINELKKVKGLKLQVWDGEAEKLPGKGVDDKLISLAKMFKAKILTCDFNLGSVAKLQNVKVLNFNELSNVLKTLPIPGEILSVKISHPGKDKDQGVGYLPDGAMVVVKEASSLVNKEVEVEVTKILQSSAGRMIFGKLIVSPTLK